MNRLNSSFLSVVSQNLDEEGGWLGLQVYKLFCESTIQSCHGNGLAPKGSKTGAVRTLKIEYAASGTSRQ